MLKTIALISPGFVMALAIMYVSNSFHYKLPKGKVFAVGLVGSVAAILGIYALARIEMGSWGGRSFYGTVFAPPLFIYIYSKMSNTSWRKLIDICAPAECFVLALAKIQCLIEDCCQGRMMTSIFTGKEFRFPSQITELVNALIITGILMLLIKRGKDEGKIYPWYMIIYGGTRFVLNLLRKTEPFVWVLPAGNFWSLIAITIGIIWIIQVNKNNVKIALEKKQKKKKKA